MKWLKWCLGSTEGDCFEREIAWIEGRDIVENGVSRNEIEEDGDYNVDCRTFYVGKAVRKCSNE